MKSLIEKAFFLKKMRLFSDLDLEILLAIAEKLHEDDYDKEEKVFSSGQVANRIYLIASGSVQIFEEPKKLLCELHAGDYFGDESLFNELPRGYAAICKTDTLFLTLSRSHLLSIISECPSVAVTLLQAYSQQLPCRHVYTSNLKNREFDKEAPQNFCQERATIAGRQGASEDKNFEVKPMLSKTDSSGYLCIKQISFLGAEK